MGARANVRIFLRPDGQGQEEIPEQGMKAENTEPVFSIFHPACRLLNDFRLHYLCPLFEKQTAFFPKTAHIQDL